MIILDFFLQVDKQLHILFSLLLFLIIFLIRKYLLKNNGFFRVVAFTIRDVLIIGILKELYDLLGFGTPDLGDILADSFGIIIPIYFYYLIKESKKIEKENFFKYEKILINTFKKKLVLIIKNLIILSNIKYKQLFFKREISLVLLQNKETYNLKASLVDILKLLKYIISLSFLWSFNLLILVIKIPFIAFFDTIEMFFKSLSYVSYKFKELLINSK